MISLNFFLTLFLYCHLFLSESVSAAWGGYYSNGNQPSVPAGAVTSYQPLNTANYGGGYATDPSIQQPYGQQQPHNSYLQPQNYVQPQFQPQYQQPSRYQVPGQMVVITADILKQRIVEDPLALFITHQLYIWADEDLSGLLKKKYANSNYKNFFGCLVVNIVNMLHSILRASPYYVNQKIIDADNKWISFADTQEKSKKIIKIQSGSALQHESSFNNITPVQRYNVMCAKANIAGLVDEELSKVLQNKHKEVTPGNTTTQPTKQETEPKTPAKRNYQEKLADNIDAAFKTLLQSEKIQPTYSVNAFLCTTEDNNELQQDIYARVISGVVRSGKRTSRLNGRIFLPPPPTTYFYIQLFILDQKIMRRIQFNDLQQLRLFFLDIRENPVIKRQVLAAPEETVKEVAPGIFEHKAPEGQNF